MEKAENKISVKTPEFVSLQFHPAGLGSRAAAFLIDQLILMLVNLLIIVSAFLIMSGQQEFNLVFDAVPSVLAGAIILVFIINSGYFLVLEYFTGGRTIGKKILGVRVIQENGHSITLLSSLIRNLLRLIDSLPAAYLTGILMIFFHSRHKRLGDIVAGTLVVHERGKKGKKRVGDIETEIKERGLSANDIEVDEFAMRSFGKKEWNLLKAYSERFRQLPEEERREMSRRMATALLPKAGLVTEGKSNDELESMLLVLYLKMKEEWEYEL